MKLRTEKGEVTISNDVFSNITGGAATNCYGVKGMAIRSATAGADKFTRRASSAPDKRALCCRASRISRSNLSSSGIFIIQGIF